MKKPIAILVSACMLLALPRVLPVSAYSAEEAHAHSHAHCHEQTSEEQTLAVSEKPEEEEAFTPAPETHSEEEHIESSEKVGTDGLSYLYYINSDGQEDSVLGWYCIENSDDSSGFSLNDNWGVSFYGVEGSVTLNNRLCVWGDVKLVLCDGAELTVTGGLEIESDSTLTIYRQTNGTGKLTATGSFHHAGISCYGKLNIYGGIITASGNINSAGIGGDAGGNSGCEIYIYGGTVTATGGEHGAGIGAGYTSTGDFGGLLFVYGGTITAYGGLSAAGIGGGKSGSGGSIDIFGGNITATGGGTIGDEGGGAGIGGGASGSSGDIYIRDAVVNAYGTDSGAAIGGGANGSGDSIRIHDSTVYAEGSIRDRRASAAIGGGYMGLQGTIYISASTITAIPKSDFLSSGQAVGCGSGSWDTNADVYLDGSSCDHYEKVGERITENGDWTWVPYAQRKDGLHSSYPVRIEPCTTHSPSWDGLCFYCGHEGAPIWYYDPTNPNSSRSECDSYTFLTNQTSLSSGWYVLNKNVQIGERIEINGNVNLILSNNKTLTAPQGIHLTGNNSLTVWSQSADVTKAGKLVITSPESCFAGIGGNDLESGGSFTLCGGVLTVNGGYKAAGIGGGRSGGGGSFYVYDGYLTAVGADYGTGIGGGTAVNADYTGGSAGFIGIYGGHVSATGGICAAGIGSGGGTNPDNGGGAGGMVLIYGGSVEAHGGEYGAGIGGSRFSSGFEVFISSGSVTASSEAYGEAIGRGGNNLESGNLTLGTIRVYSSPEASVPVPTDQRISFCRAVYARLETCSPHGDSFDGVCPYCGGFNAPIVFLDPSTGELQRCESYELLGGYETTLTSGWYFIENSVQMNPRVEINGNVNILLRDGIELTVVKGFHVTGQNSLTIWAQSGSESTAGRLIVSSPDNCFAGIGGNDLEPGGIIAVNGGVLTINGGYKASGIGGGRSGAGGTVTINGGFVTVSGSDGASGIGGGTAVGADYSGGSVGSVTINGGVVNAIGGNYAAGIGGGAGTNENNGSSGGFIAVNGGTVTATGGVSGAGIGGGCFSGACEVVIRGGSVTAEGGNYASGIGGGYAGEGCTIKLGWTVGNERIYASSYEGEVVFENMFKLEDTGEIACLENVGGNTLIPARIPALSSVRTEIRERPVSDGKTDLRFVYRVDFNDSCLTYLGNDVGPDQNGFRIIKIKVALSLEDSQTIGTVDVQNIWDMRANDNTPYFLFTAVVTGIPEAVFGRTIDTVPTVTYSHNGVSETVTAPVFSGSVNGVNNSDN